MAAKPPTDRVEAKQRLRTLYVFIWKARHAYYTLDEPFVSDAVYDDLFREAESIEHMHEGLKEEIVATEGWVAAPTDVVGSSVKENPFAE